MKQREYKKGEWYASECGRHESQVVEIIEDQVITWCHTCQTGCTYDLSSDEGRSYFHDCAKRYLHLCIKDEHGQDVKHPTILTATLLRRASCAEWNKARESHPKQVPAFECADLRDLDLRERNLRHADFRGAYLVGTTFSYADLSGANFRGADLRHTTFYAAIIDGAQFEDDELGGPGHILCGLTDKEWEMIQKGRE